MNLLAAQVHGILMATAWGLIIPCGVLVSRYGKPWTHWFVTHRTVQVLSGAIARARHMAGASPAYRRTQVTLANT